VEEIVEVELEIVEIEEAHYGNCIHWMRDEVGDWRGRLHGRGLVEGTLHLISIVVMSYVEVVEEAYRGVWLLFYLLITIVLTPIEVEVEVVHQAV
jgi:hypothetical protein